MSTEKIDKINDILENLSSRKNKLDKVYSVDRRIGSILSKAEKQAESSVEKQEELEHLKCKHNELKEWLVERAESKINSSEKKKDGNLFERIGSKCALWSAKRHLHKAKKLQNKIEKIETKIDRNLDRIEGISREIEPFKDHNKYDRIALILFKNKSAFDRSEIKDTVVEKYLVDPEKAKTDMESIKAEKTEDPVKETPNEEVSPENKIEELKSKSEEKKNIVKEDRYTADGWKYNKKGNLQKNIDGTDVTVFKKLVKGKECFGYVHGDGIFSSSTFDTWEQAKTEAINEFTEELDISMEDLLEDRKVFEEDYDINEAPNSPSFTDEELGESEEEAHEESEEEGIKA